MVEVFRISWRFTYLRRAADLITLGREEHSRNTRYVDLRVNFRVTYFREPEQF